MDKVTLDPDDYSLDFKSTNKTDSICSFYRWGIPYDKQEFIRANQEAKKNDMFGFFKETYKDDKLKKQDPRFEPFKAFVMKCARKTTYFNLTDNQIHEVVSSATYKKPMDLARQFFPEKGFEPEDINFLRGTASSIGALIEAFGLEYEGTRGQFTDVIITENDYVAPETEEQVLNKVKKYVPECGFVKSTLDAYQRKCIRFLKSCLSATRFLKTINSIRDVVSRKIFEEEFIKALYDKPDLIPEDVNGYIDLCQEYVTLSEVAERINILNKDFRQSNEGDDPAVGGLAIRSEINQNLTNAHKTLDGCKGRIATLSKALAGEREKRLAREGAEGNSIHKLVIKVTTEAHRKNLLLAAKDYDRRVLGAEVKRIMDADQDQEGEIHGIDITEILGGYYYPPAEA